MGAILTTEDLPLTNCGRDDIKSQIETAVLDTAAADDETLEVSGGAMQAKPAVPRWEKITVAHTTLKALGAVASGSVEVLALIDGGVIHAVKAMNKVQFAGGTISALSGTVGITGTAAKYLGAHNMWTAPSNNTFSLGTTVGAEGHTLAGGGSATSIKLTATATGGNLDALTAGSIDIWILWSATV